MGLQRPSNFLCLLQKLLQIQPEKEVIQEYLEAREFKYLQALTAFYIRLTYPAIEVYTLLEPLLEDYRKLRWRREDGGYEIVHVDEWVDMLLREERVCDIILPRLTKREVCEGRDGLLPRISKLETSLIKAVEGGEESDASDDSMSDVKRWKLERLKQASRLSALRQKERASQPKEVEEAEYTSQEEEEEEGGGGKRRFVSPTPSVSPDRQFPPPPLEEGEEEEEGGYVSRSPSRSPDRDVGGWVSRSPSRSPDRDAEV